METYIKLEKLGEVCIDFFWNDSFFAYISLLGSWALAEGTQTDCGVPFFGDLQKPIWMWS